MNIFFQVVVLLDKCGSRLTNLTDLEDVETLKKIFNEDLAGYNNFSEVYDVIDDFKMVEKYGGYGKKKKCLYHQNNWICLYTYHGLQKDLSTQKEQYFQLIC